MDIRIYNQELQKIKLIDKFSYFTASSAYNSVGSFELHCPVDFFQWLKNGYYLTHSNDSKHAYVIEYVAKETDENGTEYLEVKGRTIDSIFDRRICIGQAAFETVEPAQIISQLLSSHVISPSDESRKIENVEIENLVNADEGGTDYSADYSNLLDDIVSLAKNAYIGFNTYISDDEKIKFNTYKGINRTEKENTIVNITVNSINEVNADPVISSLDSWSTVSNAYSEWKGHHPLEIVIGGSYGATQLDKSKYMDRIPIYNDEGKVIDYEYIWRKSGYMYQSLPLDAEHIYYIFVSGCNKTTTQIGCGIMTESASEEYDYKFSINFPALMSGYTAYSHLFVPETSGNHTFAVGYGDLEETEGQHAYFDAAVVIDLTATFGAGNEPTLTECDESIYYSEGWKYKTKVITLVENSNPIMAFSRDRDTLLTVEYLHNSTNEKNKMYVKGADGTIASVASEDATGINLKESFLDSGIKRESDGVTIPLASYTNMLKNAGKSNLNSLTDTEAISGTFYMLSNKKYGIDFYLGDMVDFIDNKLGIVTYKRISAITETWNENGYTLDITLGEDILNITEFVKLVSKGVV
jgi:hypothetical protein